MQLIELKQNVNNLKLAPAAAKIGQLIELKQNVNAYKTVYVDGFACTINRTKVECKYYMGMAK